MISISYRLLLNVLLVFPGAASVAGADWCLAQGRLDCSTWRLGGISHVGESAELYGRCQNANANAVLSL